MVGRLVVGFAFWVGERGCAVRGRVGVRERTGKAGAWAGPGGCSIRDAWLLLVDRDRDRNVWEAGRVLGSLGIKSCLGPVTLTLCWAMILLTRLRLAQTVLLLFLLLLSFY